MGKYILVINPGSTSTKIAVYKDRLSLFEEKLTHSLEQLRTASWEKQKELRKKEILQRLENHQFSLQKLSAIAARGGLIKPVKSGTYLINQQMIEDLKEAKRGNHASNLGAIIAKEIAEKLNIAAFIVDPVVVDEMEDIYRLSGMPILERTSIFHALNHKATARRYAKEQGKRYENINLIVCHLGGGITVGAHQKGRVIDVNNALDGDGPMSPERSGSVPIGPLYRLILSGKYSFDEIRQMNVGSGGLVAYLGTNNAQEVIERIKQGDQYAKTVIDAMIAQIAKEIGAAATVLKGDFEAILITGGLANESYIIDRLKKRIAFLGPIHIYPGENEMEALALGVLQVLNGEVSAYIY